MRLAGHTVCAEDIELHMKTKIKLEVLGRTNHLISFGTSRTAYNTKKKIRRGYTDRQQRVIINLLLFFKHKESRLRNDFYGVGRSVEGSINII
jgi:hypothetical protein